MKFKRIPILCWQTFCLHLFLVLFGSTLTMANVSEQETMPFDEAAKPLTIPDDSGSSTPTKPVSDSKMPDISGMWTYNPTPPAPEDVNRDLIAPPQNFLVRRSRQTGVDFEYLGNREPTAAPRKINWEPGTRRFLAVSTDNTLQKREMFELSTDGNQLSVRILTTVDDAKRLAANGLLTDKVFIERYLTEQWRRAGAPGPSKKQSEPSIKAMESPANQRDEEETDVTRLFHLQSSDATSMLEVVEKLFQGRLRRISANHTTNSLVVVALPSICSEVQAVILKLDATPSRQRPAETNPVSPALPGTSAAKQLVERLEAQESAAVSEATTIRQLQANGQSEQNSQAIDEHQRKLANLLSTAFDMKMQLEIIQVQELQSRLSRLERQIGQRKELREKIIARRAGELISGESLRWNATTTAEPSSTGAVKEVPDSTSGASVIRNERRDTPVPLRWRSGIVEIFADTVTKMGNEQISVGSGVLVSSSGLVLSQLSSHPGKSPFLARLDDGRHFLLQFVENPGNNLYLFRLPPGTRINHYFKPAVDQIAVSDEVYVWGKNIGSPEHKLSLFATQVALKDRFAYKDLPVWQLSKPDHYGASESLPVLNAKGELLGIALRDTGELLLVLPVEQLKQLFPKSLAKILNSSSPMQIESPSTSVVDVHPVSEMPALLQKLQGKWVIEKSVSGLGENPSEEQIAQSGDVMVEGNLVTIPFTQGNKRADVPVLMEIQSPGNPQGVRVTFDPNGIASKALGIIDCEKDRLRLCIGQAEGTNETLNESSRPKFFAPGSDVIYLELRRKPTEIPESPIESRSSLKTAASIETIAAGLDTSAAAIKNLSVTTDYKKRHVYGLPFDAPIELTLVTKTIIDSEGRLRVKTTGQQINIEPDGKSARAYNGRWETVFRDGESRSLTWYESNPPTASIDKSPSLHGIHPREFTTHFQSQPVSEIIRTSATEIAEQTVWDDRPVTIVQTTPIQNANDARRYRFWIDQERNVVVRRAIAIRFAEGQPWQEYARIENHDYQQIAPGIWLPSKVKYESLEVTPELTPAKLSWSYEGTNRDWKVNSELPVDTFELAFPEGTVVNVHRSPRVDARAAVAEMMVLQEREMDSFQGTWCFDTLQSSAWPKPIGLPTDSAGRKSEQRWTIAGDRITWTSLDGEPIEVSFAIDPTKTPKQIDFTFLSGPQKGMKSIGIYEPQKGNANYLWLCMTNPGTEVPRPTAVGFSSEKQQSMIGIYPVEKPNTLSVPESLKRFQGDWQMTLCDSTLEAFGASQEVVKKWNWTISGDEILWNRNGEVWMLKIDVETSKSPSEVDLIYLTGPHKGSKCLGMFQWGGIDQSQLMIAIQDPGSDASRPSKFSMSSDIKTGLMILEPRSANR